jgi:hypothetical protein
MATPTALAHSHLARSLSSLRAALGSERRLAQASLPGGAKVCLPGDPNPPIFPGRDRRRPPYKVLARPAAGGGLPPIRAT